MRIIRARGVVIPYFRVRGSSVDDIEGSFSVRAGVKEIRFVDSVEDEYLLRVEWALDYDDVQTTLTETEIALIKAVGTNEQWTFDIRGTNSTSHSKRLRLGFGVQPIRLLGVR